MPKNSLITQGTIYAKCYDALRGVDFSSDHTQVNEHRFAYLCNMYKDYKSAQGNGVETVPGYRKIANLIGQARINGIHERKYIVNGEERTDVYIHAGTNLEHWINFPAPQNVSEGKGYTLGSYTTSGSTKNFTITVPDCYIVDSLMYPVSGETYGVVPRPLLGWANESRTWSDALGQYTFSFTWPTSADVDTGTVISLTLKRYPAMTVVSGDMADHESVSFSFNNVLYILDGTNFIKCSGITCSNVEDDAYIPTIFINGIPSGENATIGHEYEQRNMLSPLFKQTYVADGVAKEYPLAVNNLDDISSIKVYGKEYMNTRLQSVDTIVRCIRESFSTYRYGDINGTFRVVKNTADDRWQLEAWTDQGWLIGQHHEGTPVPVLKSDYDPEDLGLEVEEPSAYAKPGFVSVDIDGWDASPLGGENGEFVFSFAGNGNWKLVGDDTTRMLTLYYGVSYDSELETTWFSTSDADPEHNLLTIVRESGTDMVEFDIVTKNGTQQIVGQTDGDKVTFNRDTGIVTFVSPPSAPEDTEMDAEPNDTSIRYYPKGYAGVVITAKKRVTAVKGLVDESADIQNIIKACTMVCMYDGRVFLSGNPKYPNNVFWCGRNADTGLIDPSYWGLLNYVTDGVETIPVKAMVPVADTLAVLKGDTAQDGSVFYHTPYETGEDLVPITYPSKQGLAGTGCTGAAVNFFDDPVFVSKHGVEAIGQLSVRLERALEHRSTLIDAKLTNQDLTKAQLCEWEGYLVLSVDGKVFLADSRQAYEGAQGTKEYEWYYLEDIGAYADQYDEYRYASRLQWEEHEQTVAPKKISWCTHCNAPIDDCTCSNSNNWVELPLEPATEVYFPSMGQSYDLSRTVANPPASTGASSMSVYATDVEAYTVYGTTETRTVHYVVRREENPVYTDEAQTYADPHAYLVEPTGAKIGGVFHPAIIFKSIGDLLLFGTDNGQVFCFNTDQRNADGTIDAQWYTFNGRTIECGCATKMDNCGIPHLTKTTVKKSIVLKTKKFDNSAAKIKVRTNRNAFNQVARINSMALEFTKMDFQDFSFSAAEKDLFQIKEKERRWVEKQYYIYSDEYMKPFALYYLAYRYYIIGRYKNR